MLKEELFQEKLLKNILIFRHYCNKHQQRMCKEDITHYTFRFHFCIQHKLLRVTQYWHWLKWHTSHSISLEAGQMEIYIIYTHWLSVHLLRYVLQAHWGKKQIYLMFYNTLKVYYFQQAAAPGDCFLFRLFSIKSNYTEMICIYFTLGIISHLLHTLLL